MIEYSLRPGRCQLFSSGLVLHRAVEDSVAALRRCLLLALARPAGGKGSGEPEMQAAALAVAAVHYWRGGMQRARAASDIGRHCSHQRRDGGPAGGEKGVVTDRAGEYGIKLHGAPIEEAVGKGRHARQREGHLYYSTKVHEVISGCDVLPSLI